MSSNYLCTTIFTEGWAGRIILLDPKDPCRPYYYEFYIDIKKPIRSITINHNEWLNKNYSFELTKTSKNRWKFEITPLIKQLTGYKIFSGEPIIKLKRFRGEIVKYVDLWYFDFEQEFPDEYNILTRMNNLAMLAEECRFKVTGREEEIIRVWYIDPRFKRIVRKYISENIATVPEWIDIEKQTELKPCLADSVPAVILWYSETRKEEDYRYQMNIPDRFHPIRIILNKSALLSLGEYKFDIREREYNRHERKLIVYRLDSQTNQFERWFEVENGARKMVQLEVLDIVGTSQNIMINEVELFEEDDNTFQLNYMDENDPIYAFNRQVFGPTCVTVDYRDEIERIPQYKDFYDIEY